MCSVETFYLVHAKYYILWLIIIEDNRNFLELISQISFEISAAALPATVDTCRC